jgi:hypothetical protein
MDIPTSPCDRHPALRYVMYNRCHNRSSCEPVPDTCTLYLVRVQGGLGPLGHRGLPKHSHKTLMHVKTLLQTIMRTTCKWWQMIPCKTRPGKQGALTSDESRQGHTPYYATSEPIMLPYLSSCF